MQAWKGGQSLTSLYEREWRTKELKTFFNFSDVDRCNLGVRTTLCIHDDLAWHLGFPERALSGPGLTHSSRMGLY